MEILTEKKTYPFLQGGGEMGEITRAYNWSQTSIGTPDQWPQSLRTTLSIILNSKFPMVLLWGKELLFFYNDAYRPTLGKEDKHPTVLGRPGAEVWPEGWSIIKPLIDEVLSGGESIWSEEQLIPIYRNGKTEDVYWTFSYSSVKDESGDIAGVFVACMETTRTVETYKKLEASEAKLRSIIASAPAGIGLFLGRDLIVELPNQTFIDIVGKGPDIVGKPLREVMPELITENQPFLQILDNVYTSGKMFQSFGSQVKIVQNGVMTDNYYNITYSPLFDADGKVYAILDIAVDVTEQVVSRQKLEEGEQQVRALVESAPFPIAVYIGKEMRIQLANQSVIDTWGKGNDVIGKLYAEVLPELDNQEIFEQLDSVFTTGIAFHAKNQNVNLVIDGKLHPYYFNYSFTPLFDAAGNVYGVMNTAADVTDLNLAKQNIELSENNLRNIIFQAPVAMCILRGKNHIVEIANDRILEIWGKSSEQVMGTPIFESLPEAGAQGLAAVMQNVYTTGETFKAFEMPVQLPRGNKIETTYLNFVYEPVYETDGSISGVIAVAIEVTDQVLSRKKIEESEARFRLLADSMLQFVWAGDKKGNLNYFNQAVYNYSGLTEAQIEKEGWLQIVHPDEREENIKQWMQSMETGEDFVFHHRFKNKNGDYRWQLSRATPQKDSEGNIQIWIGTSTDIHEQKLFEEKLQARVEKQTEELVQANEQLMRSNQELSRSNTNLEEFAYAASHDLKEPVRKVHIFSNRLKNSLSDRLTDEEKNYFERVERSSLRMNSLIDDLLSYSQVSMRPRNLEEVGMNQLVDQVLGDLDLEIEEKDAKNHSR